jgi:hypothetical protein
MTSEFTQNTPVIDVQNDEQMSEPKAQRLLGYFEMLQAGLIWLPEMDEDSDDE